MKRAYSLFIMGLTILFPTISHAAVNLPWSTTYNCADWTQSNGSPNCDGLTIYGDWNTSDGKEEQITAAANYPGGASGKGQRHWLGDGWTNNSGGTRIEWTSPQSELWIRTYMRFQSGLQWNPLVTYKIFYIDVTLPYHVVLNFDGPDKLSVSPFGYSYYSNGNGWNTIMANGGTDANGNKTSDGQWHLYEVHIKMDTNGSNGIAEWWVDGVQILYRADVNYGTHAGWITMVIGSNSLSPANGQSAYYVDYDDISISGIAATSGGNSSGSGNGSNGSSDASISGGGCGFVKDISGKGQGAKGKGLSMVLSFLLLILLMLKKIKIRYGRLL